MSSALTFKSKIDTFLLVIMMCGVVACFLAGLEVFESRAEMGWPTAAAIIAICVLGAGLPLWVLFSTRYLLADDTLDVRCGPFRWRVLIKDIVAVETTRAMLSSPALSLDRLRIRYGANRAIMISPDNREAFLRQLEARRKAAA